MTKNQQTILTCMGINVENATTPAMRREAEYTLARFREHLRLKPVISYAPFERFLEDLERGSEADIHPRTNR
jgi:hypothetical protein